MGSGVIGLQAICVSAFAGVEEIFGIPDLGQNVADAEIYEERKSGGLGEPIEVVVNGKNTGVVAETHLRNNSQRP